MIETIFLLLLIFSVAAYVALPRQTKNLIALITPRKRKRFVVCHMRMLDTGAEEVYNIVPAPDHMSKIGDFRYNLNPIHAILRWKGRLHFLLNEKDSTPITLRQYSEKDIIFQANEVNMSLENDVVSTLFSKKKDVMMIVMGCAFLIMLIVVIYNITVLQKIDAALEQAKGIIQSSEGITILPTGN